MIAVTCANGHLGRATLKALHRRAAADKIVAVVRHVNAAADLAAQGFVVRHGDYDLPDSLVAALRGVEKCLLISSPALGHRVKQHERAIDAAKAAGVSLLAYTSVLHADRSSLGLARDHVATEAYLRHVRVPFVVLRNGWYLENYSENLQPALRAGSLWGCAQEGRVAAASRADYAAAAAVVLTEPGHINKIYELAGDSAFTMRQLVAAVAAHSGRRLTYGDLDAPSYSAVLQQQQLPPEAAHMLADCDLAIAQGGLDDDGHQLSRLIGRPTETLDALLAQVLGSAQV